MHTHPFSRISRSRFIASLFRHDNFRILLISVKILYSLRHQIYDFHHLRNQHLFCHRALHCLLQSRIFLYPFFCILKNFYILISCHDSFLLLSFPVPAPHSHFPSAPAAVSHSIPACACHPADSPGDNGRNTNACNAASAPKSPDSLSADPEHRSVPSRH